MTKPTIYLDMDGVCCDFIKDAVKAHGREDLSKNWPKELYNVEDALGITLEAFWGKLSLQEDKFWSGLEEFPWFWELYNGLSEIGDVYFCSAPTLDANCVKGKLIWLQDRFGFKFKK